MKKVLYALLVVVVAALIVMVTNPGDIVSQIKPYVSSLFVRNTLTVYGDATFGGTVTFDSTVSWPDSTFGHLEVQDSLRVTLLTVNGNMTINDSVTFGTGGAMGSFTPLLKDVHDIGSDVNGWDSVFAGHVKVVNVNASGAVATGALTVTGNASPEADGTRDLGTDVAKWDSVFAGHLKVVNVNASGASTFATTISVTGASTLDSVYARKLVLNAGTKQVIDSISAVNADTLAVWVGGKAFVLPVRP